MIYMDPIITIIISIVVLVFSAVLHEIAHGFAAFKLGDPTAKLSGRLTLNPIPHIDPIMSVLLPALLIVSGSPILFGAAKPVPISPLYFKDGRKDMALTALAGPLTNIGLVLIGALLFHLLPQIVFSNFIVFEFIKQIIRINLILGIINLIPIPPVDGSRVLSAVMPKSLAYAYESIAPYGIFLLLFLLMFTNIGSFLGIFISTSLTYLNLPLFLFGF
ncbi:MAG: site-2 protease family protein [Armatimonadetes bacterium]|nr:MAG: site-2 protease family protein [Armatimonadota bacterium]